MWFIFGLLAFALFHGLKFGVMIGNENFIERDEWKPIFTFLSLIFFLTLGFFGFFCLLIAISAIMFLDNVYISIPSDSWLAKFF